LEFHDAFHQPVASRTAGAAVAHGHDVVVARELQREAVDVQGGHVVHEAADPQAGLVFEQILQQRRLARAEEAGEDLQRLPRRASRKMRAFSRGRAP